MIDLFIKTVCEYFHTTTEELYINNKCRRREIVIIRHFIFFFIRKHTRLSLSQIGKIFNKDHASVLHSVTTITNLIRFDKLYRAHYEDLKPQAKAILSFNIKSVKRKFNINEVAMLINLCFDEDTSNRFMKFYKENEDLELKL